ncbi:MAG TPA: hypothetical protein VH639_25865 [Bryobacteraceae bacterium]
MRNRLWNHRLSECSLGLATAAAAAAFFWASAAPQVKAQDGPPAAPQAAPQGGPGAAKGGRGGGGGRGGPRAPEVPAGPVKRLANGKPDIQGYWNARGGGLFSIEATEARKQIGVNAGKGIVIDPADGKIPYQPWAREKEIDLSENHTIEESDAHCYTSGIPHMVEAQSSFQILQPEGPAGYVVMIWEYMHNYRIIPTDGRPHVLADSVHLFAGDPKGHWEGDTLVVDDTNQNARTWFDIAANFHSDQIHVVERLQPVDANRIDYAARIEDPKVYTRPWTVAFTLARNMTPNYRNMEFSCWEGEHDVTEKYTLESQGADPKNLPKK